MSRFTKMMLLAGGCFLISLGFDIWSGKILETIEGSRAFIPELTTIVRLFLWLGTNVLAIIAWRQHPKTLWEQGEKPS